MTRTDAITFLALAMCPLPPVDTIAQRSDLTDAKRKVLKIRAPRCRCHRQGWTDQIQRLPTCHMVTRLVHGAFRSAPSLVRGAISLPAPNIPIVFCGGVTLALCGMLATPVKSLPPLASIDAGARAIGREEEPEISRFQARDGTWLAYRFYAANNGARDRVAILVHGSSASK